MSGSQGAEIVDCYRFAGVSALRADLKTFKLHAWCNRARANGTPAGACNLRYTYPKSLILHLNMKVCKKYSISAPRYWQLEILSSVFIVSADE